MIAWCARSRFSSSFIRVRMASRSAFACCASADMIVRGMRGTAGPGVCPSRRRPDCFAWSTMAPNFSPIAAVWWSFAISLWKSGVAHVGQLWMGGRTQPAQKRWPHGRIIGSLK